MVGSLVSKLTLVLALAGVALAATVPPPKPLAVPFQNEPPVPLRIDFNRDVRPILSENCWKCHGPDRDATAKTGGMRLDTFEEATKEAFGAHPIVPGKPDQSRILARVSAPDPMSKMPPPNSGLKPLTPRQTEILRKWIDQGAKYDTHWAFVPPVDLPLPIVKNKAWPRQPLDAFVLAQLEKSGLQPEPAADKATLARRASLTLTGLQPTPEELDRFIKDTRKDAYERFVDKLLESQRYGEHEARYWLDAVRYADTHGLHIDNYREVWPYRDWVVKAINEDLPFDQFLTWQIAGDLLPQPTLDQYLATGYVRMNVTTNEGGVIKEEFLAKNTFDRTETTATVFLGLTMTCARCHDHRYDPLTHQDYYRLYAFFNNTEDDPLDGNLNLHPPVIRAPSTDQSALKSSAESQRESLLAKTDPKVVRAWATERLKAIPTFAEWEYSGPYTATDYNTAVSTPFAPEGSGQNAKWEPIKLPEGTAVNSPIKKENASGYFRTTVKADTKIETELAVGSDDGVKVWLDGKLIHDNPTPRGLTIDQDKVKLSLTAGSHTLLIKVTNGGGPDGVSVSLGAAPDRALRASLGTSGKETPEALRKRSDAYLLFGPESPSAAQYREVVKTLERLDKEIPYAYVAKERADVRKTFLLKRGEYDQPREEIARGLPTVFGTFDPQLPQNRLGLSKWLTNSKNPLVSRVFVNRVWQQHFGTGIVKTSEDFGSQGEYPVNKDLIDHLAVWFVKNGWSQKKLHKLIVTSAAFMQSSKIAQSKYTADPENRLASRGPRYRLDGEVLRDQALHASGLLAEAVGGKGTKPYQPANLWEPISFNISDTFRYVQDKGDSLYRRSLYMFLKRTSPPPLMTIFDGPSRESCSVRRPRTDTPSQALMTMNETGFVEAARNLAQLLLKQKGTDQDRLVYAFRFYTARIPDKSELAVLTDFLNQQSKTYKNEPDAAKALVQVGESPTDGTLPPERLAAWTMVASLIQNLDESMTQH